MALESRLRGKKAVITGASEGIGRVIDHHLALYLGVPFCRGTAKDVRHMRKIFRTVVATAISIFLVLGITASKAAEEEKNTFTFAADEWCPQHCQYDKNREGYIIDIVKEIFAVENVPIKIIYVPWQRAVKGTQTGKYDGLLTPTKKSNPELFFHDRPIGHQEYCIYARKKSTWKYNDFYSFKNTKVAYLKGSGLGKLDVYFDNNKNDINIQLFPGTDDYVIKLFKFLDRERADSVIITSDVYFYSVKNGSISDNFKVMGCLGKDMLYVGISPMDKKRSEKIKTIIDKGIQKLKESGKLKSIFANYGIPILENKK